MIKPLLVVIAATWIGLPAGAQQAHEGPAPAQVEQRVEAGVDFLVSQVQRDGSVGRDGQNRNAMTALMVMSMISAGHQPADYTPEGKVLRDAMNFILRDDRIDRNGYYGNSDGSRMYGHGIVTLMLCEMLGMGVDDAQDALIRRRARAAIDLILRAQNTRKREERYLGGWRYEPSSNDSDLSVTVWQVMSLRAAHSAGMQVPAQAIDNAVAYLERSYQATGRERGGFGYEPGQGPRYATTAAGLLAMLVCGRYEHEQVTGSANYLLELGPQQHDQWFYYGTYYYAVAMYQVGGEHARTAQAAVGQILSAGQHRDGYWTSEHYHERNPIYATCMAILALSVRHHYLPIYQR